MSDADALAVDLDRSLNNGSLPADVAGKKAGREAKGAR